MKHRKKVVKKKQVKSGWTSRLGRFIFEKTKISCKFDFKHVWITKDGKITTSGVCECKAYAKIVCHRNILMVDIDNISRDFAHKRVYQIRGDLKEKMVEQLEHSSGQSVRMKLVNDLITDNTALNNQFNPFVPKLGTIRNLKYKSHPRGADPVDVLLDWKDADFQNVLMAVSHSPFYIFYRTPLQLAWYIVESKKGPISISIDATGSLFIPPSRSQKMDRSDKLKHVFLYTIMAKTATKSVPIGQMLSQDHSADFILFFPRKMFKDLKAPSEIVCDESKALLKALSGAFAFHEKIEQYVAACMSWKRTTCLLYKN